MMRIVSLLSLLICGSLLQAQTARIEYKGDPLPDKDRQSIEQIVHHEAEFYAQFGLPDTLMLKLHVFEKKHEAMKFLYDAKVNLRFDASGVYVPQLQTAFLLGKGKEQKTNLPIIYHELSHYFVHQLLGGWPPTWLNEGLASYFQHCEMTKKKGVVHTFPKYEQGRVRTMYMLDEVDLPTFMNSGYGLFMKQQITDEQYSYILSHALVTFWIDTVPRDVLKQLIVSLQNKKDSSTVVQRIESIYPGGFNQFEKDFETIYK